MCEMDAVSTGTALTVTVTVTVTALTAQDLCAITTQNQRILCICSSARTHPFRHVGVEIAPVCRHDGGQTALPRDVHQLPGAHQLRGVGLPERP